MSSYPQEYLEYMAAVHAVRRVEAERDRLREALRYIEWVWDPMGENICPSCGMTETSGHDWSCRTAKALSGPESRGE